MANPLTVKGATIIFTAMPPLTIVTLDHSASEAPSGAFVSSEGNEILLQSDLEKSLESYKTNYSLIPAFPIPGEIKFKSLISISALSTLVKKEGEPVVTMGTTGKIECEVTMKAQIINPTTPPTTSEDPTPTYILYFSILDAAQTLAISD